MTKTVHDIVQQWYAIGNGEEVTERDVFFRFISVWIAFNALYHYRATQERGTDVRDRCGVKFFADQPDNQREHERLLTQDSEYRDAVDTLRKRPIYRVPERRGQTNWVKIINEKSLHDVLMAVYQVRCNLFHGGKIPENPRDEGLVSAAHTVVSKLIEPVVSGEENVEQIHLQLS